MSLGEIPGGLKTLVPAMSSSGYRVQGLRSKAGSPAWAPGASHPCSLRRNLRPCKGQALCDPSPREGWVAEIVGEGQGGLGRLQVGGAPLGPWGLGLFT